VLIITETLKEDCPNYEGFRNKSKVTLRWRCQTANSLQITPSIS